MRLTSAFFANHVDLVDQMLNVEGGFWKTTTVAANSTGFRCCAVVLVDTDAGDVGRQFALHIDAEGPHGTLQAPAFAQDFTLDRPTTFMCLTSLVLPIAAGGGRHAYTFRIGDGHDRVDVPLAIRVTAA
ncbi:hypothetical protein [Mycobacterium neglectum]|jgi:hypothetical protein|uniref:hypothetical protein n=1 Tax=Mycobacterium neglectum TaxID=242737 RepID=UPI000BFEDCAF|nr:hypothetical protein [Mycobacterium neglectum]